MRRAPAGDVPSSLKDVDYPNAVWAGETCAGEGVGGTGERMSTPLTCRSTCCIVARKIEQILR